MQALSLLADQSIARTKDAIREVLDSKDRIPYPGWRGDGFYYDFWQDADHPRGCGGGPLWTSIAVRSRSGMSCWTSTR
jgi:prolyl oligopeptidase PreP (S9A serine peptidase family)